jgi:hypothetical protein
MSNRKHKKTGRSHKEPRHVRLCHTFMKTEAWKSLSVYARAVGPGISRALSAVCPRNLFGARSLILSSTTLTPICDHVARSSLSGSRQPQTNTTWILTVRNAGREQARAGSVSYR